MREIARFLVSVFAGLLLHQTSSITHRMPHGWQQLTGYVFGVLGAFPVILLWHRRFSEIKNPDTKLTASYTTGFLGVGSGVALGWLIDTLFGVDRE
jgi:hypothetical protein